MEGWFKFERKWLENNVLTQDVDHLSVWIHLVAGAAFEPRDVIFRGKPVTLQPGQLITGRRKLAKEVHVQEDKVQRILKRFEEAGYLTQEMSAKNRCIFLRIICLEGRSNKDTYLLAPGKIIKKGLSIIRIFTGIMLTYIKT